MIYAILSDIVIFFHLLWILFLIFGVYWGLKFKWVMYCHLAALVFSITMQLRHWFCPLTYVENYFRRKVGTDYDESFIDHYLELVIYRTFSGNQIFYTTIVVVAVTLALYGWQIFKEYKNRTIEDE